MLLSRYLKDIKRFPRIPVEKQKELLRKYIETKDEKYLLEVYNSLLIYVYKYTLLSWGGSDTLQKDYMSLIQEANISLLKSLRQYNPDYDNSPGSFATYRIKWILSETYRRNTTVIFSRRSLKDKSLTKKYNFISLDAPLNQLHYKTVTGSDFDYQLHKLLHQSITIDRCEVEQTLEKNEKINRIKHIIETNNRFTNKEKLVLNYYYFEGKTIPQIAKIMKVSRQRVQQIQLCGITKLRQELGELT